MLLKLTPSLTCKRFSIWISISSVIPPPLTLISCGSWKWF